MNIDWNTWNALTLVVGAMVFLMMGFILGYLHQLDMVKTAEKYVNEAERVIKERDAQLKQYQRLFRKEIHNR